MRSSPGKSNRGACRNLFSRRRAARRRTHGKKPAETRRPTPMKNIVQNLLAASLIAGMTIPANAQTEIQFDSVANPVQLPAGTYFGEVGGVATNSKGDIFVYTSTGHPTITIGTARPFAHGGSRLFQFDKTGKFVREIGQDSYG